MLLIESTQNAVAKAMRALSLAKERKESGLFLVEGEKLCGEALGEGLEIDTLFVLEGREELARPFEGRAKSMYSVKQKVLDSVCDTKTPQPIVLSAKMQAEREVTLPAVALDGIQDPGNLGTILRTCDAAGFSAILGEGCADVYSPKAVRGAMGSTFRVPVQRSGDLAGLLKQYRAQGTAVIVSALEGSDFFGRQPLMPGVILVVGSEGKGVSQPVFDAATHVFSLPMKGGNESLNASVAAAIMVYDLYRETL